MKSQFDENVEIVRQAAPENTQEGIAHICNALKRVLLEKNKKYGDSALKPARIFSRADEVEQLKVRLDDKISRIRNGSELRKNDLLDFLGYCVLLCHANGWHNFDEMID